MFLGWLSVAPGGANHVISRGKEEPSKAIF
jgi:hypothetical protein